MNLTKLNPNAPRTVLRMRRVIGPPGCGKTHRLGQICQHASRHYGGEKVMVCSLTKSAARNVAQKKINGEAIPIPQHNIGTLHSFAYRALERPDIADTEKGVKLWNEWIVEQGLPTYRLSVDGGDMDDTAVEAAVMQTNGDQAYNTYCIARARLQGIETLPSPIQAWAQQWEEFKRETNMMDFAELLERAYYDVEHAPGDPQVLLLDEGQDTPKLGMRLIRKWGEQADWFFVVGDPLQNLYHWAGTDPESFTVPVLPADQQEVLAQSYRVPRKVRDFAFKWIEPHKLDLEAQLGKKIEYHPRREGNQPDGDPIEGSIRKLGAATWKYPEPAIKDAQKYLEAGKEVMFIASCSYMLVPLIAALRQQGIPFHNPYRQTRGDWNPLQSARGTSSAARLLAFLRLDERAWGEDIRIWNAKELHLWVEVMESKGLLKHGAKEKIKAAADRPLPHDDFGRQLSGELDLGDLAGWFESLDDLLNVAELIAQQDAWAWFKQHLLKTKAKAMEFPLAVAQKHGPAKLRARPQVIVGTIHSLKGAEAECSPYDEPVLTTEGYVPIGELDPNKHRLVSYNKSTDSIRRGRVWNRAGTEGRRTEKGYPFIKASRPYRGRLLTIKTGDGKLSRTRVTPNHHLLVRFNQAAESAHVVYLMRRGNWWRIGVTSLCSSKKRNGLAGRMAQEDAEQAWVLQVCDSREDALAFENILSFRYGIPQCMFNACHGSMSQDLIDAIFRNMEDVMTERAHKLLEDCWLDERWPLMQRQDRVQRTGARNRWVTRAANAYVLQGYLEIPVDIDERTPEWQTISVDVEQFCGEVYSLEVQPLHYYVSGGAVVHNCVYVFPDLSGAGMQNWERPGPEKEGVRRAFYVAFTRASETLVLCQRATRNAIQYPSTEV